eukprot:CAMPEP_0177483560 /NCGR_PEP_ID=MMETSP0369-20130122/27543_1 /TAXON_ID=447022 ORGANISM="Scrippsiella hangoei-like, Strain SHHI-4" /NCGR_SAMPLE_ID=MMETSP0369 /ASSEMBLY_ACC=CAM_ASM_000364 /LENGTH=48 /DNA_ID= /DNA_START= /DNA_END= /DNA_ORIENTATION=
MATGTSVQGLGPRISLTTLQCVGYEMLPFGHALPRLQRDAGQHRLDVA